MSDRRISAILARSRSMSRGPSSTKSSSSISASANLVDVLDDHLQCAVVELGVALDPHVVAVVELAIDLIAGVPHHARHGAGAVRQPQAQIEVAVPVGAQLLVRGEKNLIDMFVFAQLIDEASRHDFGGAFMEECFDAPDFRAAAGGVQG